jgi:hypothetical protein
MKLGVYITSSESSSTEYYINPPIVARQRVGKNVTAATDAHATVEELLDASFSMRFMYQMKVCDQFFPELLFPFIFTTWLLLCS